MTILAVENIWITQNFGDYIRITSTNTALSFSMQWISLESLQHLRIETLKHKYDELKSKLGEKQMEDIDSLAAWLKEGKLKVSG